MVQLRQEINNVAYRISSAKMGVVNFYKTFAINDFSRKAFLKKTDRVAVDLFHCLHRHFAVNARNFLLTAEFRNTLAVDMDTILENTAKACERELINLRVDPKNIILCIDARCFCGTVDNTTTCTCGFFDAVYDDVPAEYLPVIDNDAYLPPKNREYLSGPKWEDYLKTEPSDMNCIVSTFFKSFPYCSTLKLQTIEKMNMQQFTAYRTNQFFNNADGEALVAYLTRIGAADYGYTADSDFFLYGGTKMLIKKSGTMHCVTLTDILNSKSLTFDQFEEACFMLGTDYNKGVHGVGPIRCILLAKNGQTVKDISNVTNIFRSISRAIPQKDMDQ